MLFVIFFQTLFSFLPKPQTSRASLPVRIKQPRGASAAWEVVKIPKRSMLAAKFTARRSAKDHSPRPTLFIRRCAQSSVQ